MSDQELKLEEVFESAVAIVRNLPKEGPVKPSDGLRLKLYALFKQATHGPNDTRKPRFYQFVEVYKWEAWRRLGDMSKEEAMLQYIEKLKSVMNTVPQDPDTVAMVDNEHFREILGKKFYEYWFNEWNNLKSQGLTVDHCTDQMGDQFALAVLRLQHGLDQTNSRLNKIESQVARTARSGQGGLSYWFYLCYPLVIYALLRAYEKRKRRLEK